MTTNVPSITFSPQVIALPEETDILDGSLADVDEAFVVGNPITPQNLIGQA